MADKIRVKLAVLRRELNIGEDKTNGHIKIILADIFGVDPSNGITYRPTLKPKVYGDVFVIQAEGYNDPGSLSQKLFGTDEPPTE